MLFLERVTIDLLRNAENSQSGKANSKSANLQNSMPKFQPIQEFKTSPLGEREQKNE